jgi:hypothetical protein
MTTRALAFAATAAIGLGSIGLAARQTPTTPAPPEVVEAVIWGETK